MAVTDKVTEKAQETAEEATEAANSATETATEAASDTSSKATAGTGAVRGLAGDVRDQVTGALADAVQDVVRPAVQQMTDQAAKQAVNYAKTEGPRIVKEQVLPQIFKATGTDSAGGLAKKGVGMAGDAIKGSGGLTGIAGKIMSKLGGGKGGGQATGYGQKRRMPIQQDVFVAVALDDAYKAWTEYKRWTEFMHRANLVDPQIEQSDQEGGGEARGSVRLSVTEKMWGFKRPFTAEVVSQVPSEHIRWKSTEGTKHVGVIAFHGIAPRLTLITVNVDHAPAGPIEKIARGARFDKRAIRADLHRFKGWVEHKSPEEIQEMEGWLGTVEDGQITMSHEQDVEEFGEENGNGEVQDREDQAGAGQEDEDREGAVRGGGRGERGGQEGEEGGEEGGEDDQAVDTTDVEPDEPEDEEGLGEGQPEDEEELDDEEEDEEDLEDEEEDEEEEPEAEERPLPTPKRRGGGKRRQPPAEDEEEEEPEPAPKRRRRRTTTASGASGGGRRARAS